MSEPIPTTTPRTDALEFALAPVVHVSQARALERELNAERAAREQAEKKADYLANALQGSAYQAKDFVELAQRAEQAEARLAEALDVLQLMRDHQNGCPLPTYEKRWNEAMDRSQVVIDGTTPPPILAELAALKAELEVHRAGKFDDSWAQQCEENWALEKERDALKAELERYGATFRGTTGELQSKIDALKLKLNEVKKQIVESSGIIKLLYRDKTDEQVAICNEVLNRNKEALSQLNEAK